MLRGLKTAPAGIASRTYSDYVTAVMKRKRGLKIKRRLYPIANVSI